MKQSSITFETSPQLKAGLERPEKEGFRSLSAQVEMIVIKYFQEKRIGWRPDVDDESRS